MICKLCLQDKDLCRKSHIIPEFMYRELFDENHRMVKFESLAPGSDSDVPTGEYEGDILCRNCDNVVIGQYEAYARAALYGGQIPAKMQNYRMSDGLEYTQASGLDYKKFKLFLLSVLWRAGISTRPFFNSVRLGPYEDKLRLMILNGDPGSASSYPCIITSYRKHNSLPRQIIASPIKIHLQKNIGYNFLINGVQYIYKITENETADWVLEAIISKNGEMKILHLPEKEAKRMINKLFGVNMYPSTEDSRLKHNEGITP